MRACRQAEVKHEETDMAYAAVCWSYHLDFISNSIPHRIRSERVYGADLKRK